MFAKSKVSQSMIDAVNSVIGEKSESNEGKVVNNVLLDEAAEKVATPTGMKVYGSSYGNSAKAKRDQTKSSVDTLKGPKDKEMKEATKPDFLDMDKDGDKKESMKKAISDKGMKEELKGGQHKIDANHNNKVDAQDFAILRGKKKVKEGMVFADKLLASINEKKDVVMPEDSSTPAKNTDVADKSYLKDMGKKPTVKSDLKNLGRFLTGKKETNEEKSCEDEVKKHEKRLHGKDGEVSKHVSKMHKEEIESLDEKNVPTSPEKWAKAKSAAKSKFDVYPSAYANGWASKKYKAMGGGWKSVSEELTEEQVDEIINEVLGKDATAGDYIHDFVHSDNPKFAGKSKAERKKMALGAYYGKQNEEVINHDDAAVTTDTLAGRMPGGKINSFKSYKLRVRPLDKEGTPGDDTPKIVEPENTPARRSHEVHESAEGIEEKVIAGTPGWEPMKKDVTDKSGAVHTPMSRAKDLARTAFKKLQKEVK